ncbi:hypothetical protein MQX03_09935 [Chryseobacterium aahli]|uniref:bacteriocin-like protein n=1 Tax=Chryseobacterium aahli TaxID=1278643 RepID=UPI001F61431C|nr:hypothetical protein [Chryseobacterium aahli]MCI3937522.1 hypothetical protein [Chryseobacterium aahli]
MKKLKKISRESMKSVFAGERGNIGESGGPYCGDSYSIYMGEQCTCLRTGGNWICGKCYHGGNYAVIASISNNCDQFGGFTGDGGLG